MKLTDLTVRNLKAPDTGYKIYLDDTLPGFGCRVTASGAKSFVWTFGEQRERKTIGRYPLISLQDARRTVLRLKAELTLGRHLPTRLKMGEAVERFFTEKGASNRASTLYINRGILTRRYEHLFKKNLEDITTDDITRITDEQLRLGYPTAANQAFMVGRTFFRWCVRRRLLQHSPLESLERPAKQASRERVLNDDELRSIWKAAATMDGHFGKIVQLLILTGCRKGEIGSLRTEWCSLGERFAQEASASNPAEGLSQSAPCSLPSSQKLAATAAFNDGELSYSPAPLAVGGENTDCEVIGGEGSWFNSDAAKAKQSSSPVERLPINSQSCTINIPSSHTKQKRSHTFPIGELSVGILRQCMTWIGIPTATTITTPSACIFPARGNSNTSFNGWSQCKKTLDKKITAIHGSPIDFHLHDLRRSYATNLQRLGVDGDVIEALLGHVSHLSGVRGTYQKHRFHDEMRSAVETYERWLTTNVTTS